MTNETYHHRILLKSEEAMWETCHRLWSHGIKPYPRQEHSGPEYFPVDFYSPLKKVDLDFLRPDLLPPLEVSAKD